MAEMWLWTHNTICIVSFLGATLIFSGSNVRYLLRTWRSWRSCMPPVGHPLLQICSTEEMSTVLSNQKAPCTVSIPTWSSYDSHVMMTTPLMIVWHMPTKGSHIIPERKHTFWIDSRADSTCTYTQPERNAWTQLQMHTQKIVLTYFWPPVVCDRWWPCSWLCLAIGPKRLGMLLPWKHSPPSWRSTTDQFAKRRGMGEKKKNRRGGRRRANEEGRRTNWVQNYTC